MTTRTRALDDDRPSFEELYVSAYQSLVRLAFVLTGSNEISEDLVQDCFVRLHRHYDRLDTPERYAKRAVVNACRSHFRKVGRERDRRPLLYVVDSSESPSASGPHPGELHDVLLTLPYRQRAAVVLRFYADLSEVEIAEALGCRPGTVGSLIHRALERMRGVLEQSSSSHHGPSDLEQSLRQALGARASTVHSEPDVGDLMGRIGKAAHRAERRGRLSLAAAVVVAAAVAGGTFGSLAVRVHPRHLLFSGSTANQGGALPTGPGSTSGKHGSKTEVGGRTRGAGHAAAVPARLPVVIARTTATGTQLVREEPG